MKLAPIIWLASLWLTGCGTSGTTHYYELQPVHAQSSPIAAPEKPVVVDKVGFPVMLDRAELMNQTTTGVYEVLEFDRWSGPLPQMAREVLIQDLSFRLGPDSVVSEHARTPKVYCEITLDITSFRIAATRAELVGSFSIRASDRAGVGRTYAFQLDETASGTDARSTSASLSHLLGATSDQIAKKIVISDDCQSSL